MSSIAVSSDSESALYRRVWRWHFYAGLICLPFLAMMALTGGLYLFKEPIESLVYSDLRHVASSAAPMLDAEALVAKARAAQPGEPIRFAPPPQPGRSVEVGIRAPEGAVAVYLDPGSGRVLGHLRDDHELMEVVKSIHSLAIAGTVANHWIEVVAGWAIVLVVSGAFLWWPRGRKGGVYSLRARPATRLWWRDLHAVTGVVAAAAIFFLAVTGMPWSAFWGAEFGSLSNAWGIGLPKYVFGPGPASTPPTASLGSVPWTLTQAPMPQSGPHANHAASLSSTAEPQTLLPSIGLNEALRIFSRMGLPADARVSLPAGPRGVYSAMEFPDDVRSQRVVHLDRYSGAVLADVGYKDYGAAGRAVEWGVSLHTGRQFGWVNQLVMLFGCLAILLLTVSAVVMWWKRRPQRRLAAPPRRVGDRAAIGAVSVAALLGLLYPLLGASMLLAMLIDFLIPTRWHERFGL